MSVRPIAAPGTRGLGGPYAATYTTTTTLIDYQDIGKRELRSILVDRLTFACSYSHARCLSTTPRFLPCHRANRQSESPPTFFSFLSFLSLPSLYPFTIEIADPRASVTQDFPTHVRDHSRLITVDRYTTLSVSHLFSSVIRHYAHCHRLSRTITISDADQRRSLAKLFSRIMGECSVCARFFSEKLRSTTLEKSLARTGNSRRPSFSRRGCASAFVWFSSAGWHTQEKRGVCVKLG